MPVFILEQFFCPFFRKVTPWLFEHAAVEGDFFEQHAVGVEWFHDFDGKTSVFEIGCTCFDGKTILKKGEIGRVAFVQ